MKLQVTGDHFSELHSERPGPWNNLLRFCIGIDQRTSGGAPAGVALHARADELSERIAMSPFMRQLRTLLIGTSFAALATTAAVAQTPAPVAPAPPMGQMQQAPAPADHLAPAVPTPGAGNVAPPNAPAARGVQMPAPTQQTLTAPTSPDPLVQKRNADAQANAEYRNAKKTSKAQYKEQVNNAKVNRQADKQAARNQLNADTQAGQGAHVPDDETKH
jgi:hypothetical protein